MPRKKAEATAEAAAPDAAAAEPVAPRRSGRNAGKEKPASAPPAPKAPRKKRAAKEAEGEEENKEEPAAKKAKPDSKAAEEPAKPESKAVDSKPASKAAGSKPPSKAAAKPASSKGKPASSKPKSTSKAGAAPKSTEDAAKKPDTIAEEEKEDVEMADKENQEKAAEAPANAKPDTAKELQVGDTLPDLTLKNEKDEDVKIAELAKEKGVVLFLVPKADTPGCNTQACGFRDNYEEFEKLGYDIYCLSADSSGAQSKWQTKKTLQYHLLSDPKRELITALGAGAGGKTKRSHLVFEKGTGKLVEKKLGVKPAESPSQALEFVKNHVDSFSG